MLTEMKNHVSEEITASKINHPRMEVGILFKDPMIAYVVGPATETQFRLAKFRKNPTKPARKFFKK